MQIRILLFVISIICFNETYAQFYPYNPYNNPYANLGYIAGQQRVVVDVSGLCLVTTAYIPTDFIEIR